MAMRWRWPPENSWMYLPESSGCEADRGQRLGDRRRAGGAGGWIGQQVEGFGDQPCDPVARVEAAERVLEDHLHLAAHLGIGRAGPRRPGCRRDGSRRPGPVEPQHRAGQRGLAAAAFPDQSQPLATPQREADFVDRAEMLRRREKPASRQAVVADHPAHLQQRLGRPRRGQGDPVARGFEECLGVRVLHAGAAAPRWRRSRRPRPRASPRCGRPCRRPPPGRG